MTSTGKYRVNTSNLYNPRREVFASPDNYSTPQRPRRRVHHSTNTRVQQDVSDGEDENTRSYIPLSERIKRLSASSVLKDSSEITHNNNEPFTYLRGSQRGPSVRNNANASSSSTTIKIGSGDYPKPMNSVGKNVKKGNELIYAQVVVDPEDKQRNKRTVHRSYNNGDKTSRSIHNNYPSYSAFGNQGTMKGRNVTTVLLNSSSDDIPSSLMEENRFNGDSGRYRSSSSPLLLSNEDYYPKSPGIVKNLQNGYGPRSRYENHYQGRSTDYIHRQSDDDYDYDYKFNGDRYGREKSPFGRDTDNSDDLYNAYGMKSASTNFIDGYGTKNRKSYKIEEEDEFDNIPRDFDEKKRSRTLERDSSFRNGYSRAEEFISRSKTLDNRISSLRERSMMLEERDKKERLGVNDPYSYRLSTSHPHQSELNNTQSTKNNLAKSKDKSYMSTNIFSTLLRRGKDKKGGDQSNNKGLPQSKSTSALNTEGTAKKTGHNSNFFTSFLEKKRNKKQLQETNKGHVLQAQNNNTYQQAQPYNHWPPAEPPLLSVVDYSDTSKPYYGESNIDTEDTSHGSDIWKKSYGNDMAKVKRRWTMREPSQPSIIQEEDPVINTSTLRRNKLGGYTSTTVINNTNSIDRRKPRDEGTQQRYFGQSENDSLLKVPRSTGKYSGYTNGNSTRYGDENAYNSNTLTRGGRTLNREYKGYGGGGLAGTPNSSGSESNTRLQNGSSRSVYLHEPAVIHEMPRTVGSSGGGGSISGLSGRRTLSKDEISNYSGSRKETKQLSRSMSLAHPWVPNKHYKEKYNEIDYSRNTNPNLPPRPPSRSPSGSLGIQSRQGHTSSSARSSRIPLRTSYNTNTTTNGMGTTTRGKPPLPTGKGTMRKPMSSSVESLLRQETPDEVLKKKGNAKLNRSKSMSVSQPGKDGKTNRFSTLWFNKRNTNK